MCRAQCVLVIALLVAKAHSWDIAISAGDRLEFYTEDGTKTATVHMKSRNITAITYDEVHNMLLYVDKQNNGDLICGYNITSIEHKCMNRSERNIRDLVFEPVSQTLFFTDTKERSINWYSYTLGARNNDNGNLLIKIEDGVPTYIAVDSCSRYVYWINTNLTTSTIERARFDGSDRQVVFNANRLDLKNIISLAIDHQTQRMFWYMPESSSSCHTYSADLDGKNIEALIRWAGPSKVIHPNSYTVSKQNFYAVGCSDCSEKTVWKFPKLAIRNNFNKMVEIHHAGVVSIVANYKMKDQFQGVSTCDHVHNNNDNSRGYYVPVCETYCFQGNCSVTVQGPVCRCEAGYFGKRCEVNVCTGHCLNNGTCILNEEEEPFCECAGEYEGDRCEIPRSLNNDGSITKDNAPSCLIVRSLEDSGRKTVIKQPISIKPLNYLEEGEINLTLGDLLENWRKHNNF